MWLYSSCLKGAQIALCEGKDEKGEGDNGTYKHDDGQALHTVTDCTGSLGHSV